MTTKGCIAFLLAAAGGYLLVAPGNGDTLEVKGGKKLLSTEGKMVDGVSYVPVEDVATWTKTQVEYNEYDRIANLYPEVKAKELIVNGDFELGTGIEISSEAPTPIPGWTAINGAAMLRVSVHNLAASMDRREIPILGKQLFGGGVGRGKNPTITQVIDVAKLVPNSGSGKAKFRLSGDLGSADDMNDGAVVTLTWLDSAKKPLDSVKILGPTREQRGYITRLYRQYKRGLVPARTVSAQIEIIALGDPYGIWSDGYVDNLSLKIEIP